MEEGQLRRMEAEFMQERLGRTGWRLWERKGPVLFSAPHSVPQFRRGAKKAGEYRTGVLARACGELVGCPVLCKTKNLLDDANFDPRNPYKDALLSFLLENRVRLVLDIHISRASRPYDVDIGTGYGRNLLGRQDYLDMVRGGLGLCYADVRVDDTFPAAGPYTVSSTASMEGGVPALQLEFNWRLLNTLSKVGETAQALASAVRPLTKNYE